MVCMMEWILNSKHYSTKVIVSVVIVAFGVGVCTVTDVEINVKGFLCALVAVFCTSLQQIVSIPNILLPGYYFVVFCCLFFGLIAGTQKETWLYTEIHRFSALF